MNRTIFSFRLFLALTISPFLHAATPLGLFAPYDINIKLKKPATGNWEWSLLGEKSYNVHGYATNATEDTTFLVNVLQIYEPIQNIVSMYQGFDDTGATVQTLTTPFTELLDSIAGGPGGGVSNGQNGLYVPCGTLSCGQFATGITYGFGKGFYLSAFLPMYFAQLSNVSWSYVGNSELFSGAKIQAELVNTFAQDAQDFFDLNVLGWKQYGLGDLTFLAEWQRDFVQRRPLLKSVQVNLRLGLSMPTAKKTDQSIIMPVAFGGDGAWGLPFGGGLGLMFADIAECGFSGQFWYYFSNEQCRRIKTFPTQTSLLYPVIANTYKNAAIMQNFNLYGQVFSLCKRFSLKALYQHWRRPSEELIPLNTKINADVVNTAPALDEFTRHQFALFALYSPKQGDFARIIPQLELFWKGSFGGTRAAIASTYGAQFSLIF